MAKHAAPHSDSGEPQNQVRPSRPRREARESRIAAAQALVPATQAEPAAPNSRAMPPMQAEAPPRISRRARRAQRTDDDRPRRTENTSGQATRTRPTSSGATSEFAATPARQQSVAEPEFTSLNNHTEDHAPPHAGAVPGSEAEPETGSQPESAVTSFPTLQSAPLKSTLLGLTPSSLGVTEPDASETPYPGPDTDAAPPASRTHTKPTRMQWFTRASAIFGCAALTFTLALPGINSLSSSAASSTAGAQQHMHTGTNSSGEESFDALNVVSVEAGESLGSFVNYQDAKIQYPFAEGVTLSDPFGERSWPVSGFHDAQDFAAPAGTPVQVIADGIVLEAGFATDGCGFGLKVGHRIDGTDVTSRYCHMQIDSHEYRVGQAVSVGDPAGRVGNTGLSFGPHLHFVITVNGEAIDPMPFLLTHNRESRPER